MVEEKVAKELARILRSCGVVGERGGGRKGGRTWRSREREKSRRRESREHERDRRGRKGAGSVRFFRSSWFEAYRSRGPGRTILLDLCARAISRSSRDLPRATNIVAITSCSWLFALAGPVTVRGTGCSVSSCRVPDYFNPRTRTERTCIYICIYTRGTLALSAFFI